MGNLINTEYLVDQRFVSKTFALNDKYNLFGKVNIKYLDKS